MIICSCSYEYGLIYPFKEISTAVPIWPFYSRRPRQACHVIANTEELPTIPIELSTKVSFVFSSPREIGELVFHGGFTKPEKKSMGFWAMDPCPKTTMGVKRAEI